MIGKGGFRMVINWSEIRMNKLFLIGLIFLLQIFSVFAFPIVENGLARAQIILPEQATKIESFAADELRRYIKRVSAADLSITNEKKASPDMPRIYVGATAAAAKAALRGEELPPASWIVKSAPEALFLLGHDQGEQAQLTRAATGTLYAVYHWLENELKILWLWPDDEAGTVCPPKDNILSGNYDVRQSPPLESAFMRQVPLLYQRRSGRINYGRVHYPDGSGGHAFTKWHKEYGESHPEWFSHKEGEALKPVTIQRAMCVSNSDFHKEIVRRWAAARAKEPEKRFDINICENDCAGDCACAKCLSWDGPDEGFSFGGKSAKNVGERYARFALEVWKLAAEIDPDVRVYAYAYSNYIYAPTKTKLNKSIMISNVPPSSAPFPRTPEIERELDENLAKWAESGVRLNYRPNIFGGYAMPENYVSQYYREFQGHVKAGMIRLNVDGPNISYATQGPLLYVMGRLLAKPKAKLETLLDEYYSGFGPAAAQVRKYWEHWERHTIDNASQFNEIPKIKNKIRFRSFFGFHYPFYAHVLFPPEAFAAAKPLMEDALEAAKNEPEALKRVQFLQAGLEHAELCADVCALFDDPEKSNAERLAAMNKVYDYRKEKMPPYAAALKFFTSNNRMEKAVWVFSDFDPESMLQLPLEWKVLMDPENRGEKEKYYAVDFDHSNWRSVSTDRHLELQGYQDVSNAWYRLQVKVPAKFLGMRSVLHLGAVDESCRLWVNGQKIGEFKYDAAIDPASWKKPLEYDVTPQVSADGELLIALKVMNEQGNSGLWRPSEIRFFQPGNDLYQWDNEFLRENLKKARGYNDYLFGEELPDGRLAWRLNGVKRGNTFPFCVFTAPFNFAAGKTYEISAEVFQHSQNGNAQVVATELDNYGKFIKYNILSFKSLPKDEWVSNKLRFKASDETKKIRVTFTSRSYHKDSYMMLRAMKLVEEPK